MIPTILMLTGALAVICGIVIILAVAKAHFSLMERSVSGEAKPLSAKKEKARRRDSRKLLSMGGACIAAGLLVFGAGWYLGYADRGSGFWLYKLVYRQEEEAVPCIDNLSENGRYIHDGKEYNYYLIVSGKDYEFCGKKCDTAETLREELSAVRIENTVILIDSYAAADEFRTAKEMLKGLGIKYETEET